MKFQSDPIIRKHDQTGEVQLPAVPTQARKSIKQTNMLTWFNLFLITIVVFNTTFCSMTLLKYYYIAAENTFVLERLLFERQSGSEAQRTRPSYPGAEVEMFGNLKLDKERLIECPPCPTPEPPTPVITNKDPVSVLNEEAGTSTHYECVHSCKVPPVHVTTLTIEDHSGKEWVGRASTKKGAKHDAAYQAIEDVYPELLEFVVHEEVVYNPQCQDRKNPLISGLLQTDFKKKC